MTLGDAIGVAAIFIGIAIILTVIFLGVNEVNPLSLWRTRRRKAREKNLPLYERLARAEERAAEKSLERGSVDWARTHFRAAQKIRREATEAMMRGEEPTI